MSKEIHRMVTDYFTKNGKIIARPRPPLSSIELVCVYGLWLDEEKYTSQSYLAYSVIAKGPMLWVETDKEVPEAFKKLVKFVEVSKACMKVIRR